jgi:membrane protein
MFPRIILRVRRWWTEELWALAQHVDRKRYLERLAIHAARSLYIVVTGFRRERIKLRASQLTYVSLLSFVPAIVVVFSLFTAMGGSAEVEASLKKFVIASLAVSQQDTVMSYVEGFLKQSKTLGGAGILILLVTTITLLSNIERAFNDIWGIARDRSILQRFQVYWPVVTLGPILMGLSLSLTAAFEAEVFGFAIKLVPFCMTVAFLTLLYGLLPNTAVPFRFALIGGATAGTLWEIAKQLYAFYAAFTLNRPSVYGSLGAVPLFILWLYVSWVLALLGATVTFAVQNARTYEPEDARERTHSQRDRELLAARLVIAVSDSFARGKGPASVHALLDQVLAPPRFARRVLQELVETQLIVETMERHGEDASYVPGRPLESISMADVVRAMRKGTEARAGLQIEDGDRLGESVSEVLVEAEDLVERALSPKSLAGLLADSRAG